MSMTINKLLAEGIQKEDQGPARGHRPGARRAVRVLQPRRCTLRIGPLQYAEAAQWFIEARERYREG